ncbi:MAG: SEC-C metal-binding domain-containing protein [Planctomycetota bacterium]
MIPKNIALETAAFLDSSPAQRCSGLSRSDLKMIAESFLNSTYEQLGKAPHLLDGEEMRTILTALLPGAFGRKDPRIPHVPEVLEAFFDHLVEIRTVSQSFEIRKALAEHGPAFIQAARAGTVAPPAPAGEQRPFVNRAEKVGRNEPCPCGSGRKFKQCCAKL